jgi:hypothetical protein
MKRFVTTGILIVLMTHALHAQHEYYFRFKIEDKAELEQITRMLSIDNVEGDTVYAYANDNQLKLFQEETEFSLTFLKHPAAQTKGISMAGSVAEMTEWDKYPTYEVYVQMMENYAANYPDICNLKSIGKTVNGRKLLVLNISDNVGKEEDEPEFFYTSTMHGDETAGFVFMLRFIDSLLTNYGTNPEITNYVNNIDIYVNPNANPDGTYTDDNSTVSNATRSNANWIDLNRNFPDPEDGKHPDGNNWQPETIAMMDFAEKHNFVLSANFHGGEEVANYPWDTWARRHVDDSLYRHLSYAYASNAIANSPPGYFNGPDMSTGGIINGYDWYSISGGRQDYMNYFQQCREITMEISSQKLLSTDKLRDYWNYNRKSLFAYMEQSRYGIHGIVTDQSGNPLKAMITLEGHDSEPDSSMVFTDPQVGDYHRMVEPGTYDVIFSSFGYHNDTIHNVSISQNDSIRVNDSLKIIHTHTITPEDTLELSIKQGQRKSGSFHAKNISTDTLNLDIAFEDTTFSNICKLSVANTQLNPDDTTIIDVEANPWNIEPGTYKTSVLVKSQMPYVTKTPIKIKVLDVDTVITQPAKIDTFSGQFEKITKELEFRNLFEQDIAVGYSLSDTSFSSVVRFDNEQDSICALSKITTDIIIEPKDLTAGTYNFNINLNYNSNTHTIPVLLEVYGSNFLQTNKLAKELKVDCYPNPFKDRLQVQLSLLSPQQNLSISILDESGKVLHVRTLGSIGIGEHLVSLKPALNSLSGNRWLLLRVKNKSGIIVKKLLHSNGKP